MIIMLICTLPAVFGTWHSPGLSTNLSWSKMLFSERSQAPSEKSQHAPLDPERGELEAVERKRRKTTNFSKEGKEGKDMEEMEEKETLGRLHIIMCDTAQ